MPDTTPSRPRQKVFVLLGLAAVLAVTAYVCVPPMLAPDGPLLDRNVKKLSADCGSENNPPGIGMPAWPDGKQRYYMRQHWTPAGELKVEVWEFLEPGHVLVSAHSEVRGQHIVIEPRWEVPPNGSVAACFAKFGVELTFRNLPRGDYVIDAR